MHIHSGHTPLVVVLCVWLTTVVSIACGTRAQDQSAEEAPLTRDDPFQQPIAFSHEIHAGQFNIDCQYCHTSARRGPVAGIPSVQRCVECHLVIANDQPEIARLLEFWERREPIPWVRIHKLPAHAHFDHQRHVLASLTCETCHGDVRQMHAAVQVAPLTMGWCLSCHDDEQASRDCLTCHY